MTVFYFYWYLQTNCEIELFELTIFNKWNQLVFSANSLLGTGFAIVHGYSVIIDGPKQKYCLPDRNYKWIIKIKPLEEDEVIINGLVRIEQFME